MSWVNDLASGLGMPAGGATLAVSLYAACCAAEKAARPQALKDVGYILGSSSWSHSVQAYAIIERVFVWTFGSRQMSWKCVRSSLIATMIFNLTFLLIFIRNDPNYSEYFMHILKVGPLVFLGEFIVAGVIADYVALAKTRILLRRISLSGYGALRSAALVLIDIVASVMLSFLFEVLWLAIAIFAFRFAHLGYGESGLEHVGGRIGEDVGAVGVILNASTLLTSIWTILILLSTTVLKLLAPLQRFTAYFFDVDEHPVQAIGIVGGALIMVGSLIWTVLGVVI